jgi:peptidoglycan/xylan/chitin deacetylase (PgdA/CDA1 family)
VEQYNIRVTFCTVGNLLNARSDVVARAASLNCEVIGHSWDHKDLTKLSSDAIRKELTDTQNTIQAITGVNTHLYRPPYGSVNDNVRNVSKELGFALINWSVDPEDWKSRNADAVHTAVMNDAGNKSIVLSHDLYGTTADAYERIIPELLAQGYQLVTVSELLSYTHDSLEAGKVYYNGK